VLHLLNEIGYPHIHGSETLAVIRLCKDVLHVEPQPAEEDGAEDGEGSPLPARGHADAAESARGHFYTNDVKVSLPCSALVTIFTSITPTSFLP
jgi:hypothetical protein